MKMPSGQPAIRTMGHRTHLHSVAVPYPGHKLYAEDGQQWCGKQNAVRLNFDGLTSGYSECLRRIFVYSRVVCDHYSNESGAHYFLTYTNTKMGGETKIITKKRKTQRRYTIIYVPQ